MGSPGQVKRRGQRGTPGDAAAQLEAERHWCARLQGLVEIGKVFLRAERLGEAWPRAMSLAAADLPIRSAVLATRLGPSQPLVWWREEVSASDRERVVARAGERLAHLGSRSGPRPDREGGRFLACPLLDGRGEALGVLQLEWPAPPGEPELAFAADLADQVASALDRHVREETRIQQEHGLQPAGDLLAMVSHEMKNLLSVLRSNITILRASAALLESEQSRAALDRMQRAGERMRRLVDDLLDSACLEASHLSVEPQRLEVAPLVAEALETAAPQAATRSIHLRSEVSPSLPPVRADGARIQQVFANILNNAIKFGAEGGTITVRAQPAGGEVQLSVTDDGPGIASEDLPHLFNRFWQARRTARLGVGLGLFIVKGIVQAHGGRVWAESSPGQGTTFHFTVPVAEPAHPDGGEARALSGT